MVKMILLGYVLFSKQIFVCVLKAFKKRKISLKNFAFKDCHAHTLDAKLMK